MKANAFVLAAGLGTRLRPLTDSVPKPLVPVCGVPLLAYSLRLCAHHGLDQVVVNAFWHHEQLLRWEGACEGVHVQVSVETPDILGTGGGLKRAADRLADRFAVLNGDVLTDVDLTRLLGAVPDGGGALALRAHAADALRYGVVAMDETGRVVHLKDIARTDTGLGAIPKDTHFSGIHAMDRRALDLLPDGFSCVVRTAYKQLLPQGLVMGLRHEGVWLDVGDPASYLEANLAVLDGRAAVPLDPFERAELAERGHRWIGPGARVAGSVERSIVGGGAVVPHDSRLFECVVWDGVHVPPGIHERTVFYGSSEQVAWVHVPADPHPAA